MTWKSIILNAIVTCAVTIAAGLVLFYFQLREPQLTYSVEQAVPFPGEKNLLAIQAVSFENTGRKEVSEVVASIRVSSGSITQHRIIAPESVSFTETINGANLRIEIQSLNPGERVKVALLISGGQQGLLNTRVSLRAPGVNGELAEKTSKLDVSRVLFIAVLAAYAGILAPMLARRSGRRVLGAIAASLILRRPLPGHSEQHQQIGSVFALNGAVEEAEAYLASRGGLAYWSESDLIAAKGLASNSSEKVLFYRSILVDLLSYVDGMAETSRAILLCNVARLSAALGDVDMAKKSIEQARSLDQAVTEARIHRDPSIRL